MNLFLYLRTAAAPLGGGHRRRGYEFPDDLPIVKLDEGFEVWLFPADGERRGI
jgi:hypothetical protein